VLIYLGILDRILSIISDFNKSFRIAWNTVLCTLLALFYFLGLIPQQPP